MISSMSEVINSGDATATYSIEPEEELSKLLVFTFMFRVGSKLVISFRGDLG